MEEHPPSYLPFPLLGISPHLKHCLRGPSLRVGQVQDLLPILQVGDDLEGLGDLSHSVPTEQLPHPAIHLHHLII